MAILRGTPGVITPIEPLGTILANNAKGIICTQGITERGEIAKNVLLTTFADYLQNFGPLVSGNDFPLMCKHALEQGSLLRVARAFHFSDIDDASSVEGTLAKGDLDNAEVIAAPAQIEFTISEWTGSGDNLTITAPDLNNPGGTVVIVSYDGTGTETATDAGNAIKSAINGGTGTHLYVATGISPDIIVRKPLPLTDEDPGNGDIVTIDLSGTAQIANAILKFFGGVTPVIATTSTWTAAAVGPGYNGTTISVINSISGKLNKVDITIQLPDAPQSQTIIDVDNTLTASGLTSLNNQMIGVNVGALITLILPLGDVTLGAVFSDEGNQDTSLINDVDFTGSEVSKTGWHSFDDVTDSMRIFNFGRPTHDANLSVTLYVENRGDMRARGYVPKGLTIQGIKDFRNGDGAFLHVPIDSFHFDLWVAEVFINNPDDLSDREFPILAGGFQAANRTFADEDGGEWRSDAGAEYGKLKGINGLPLNLISQGNIDQNDEIYESGVNAVVNQQVLKIVNWGNRTTLLDTTSLLSKLNIADLVIFISREIRNIAILSNFQPNDVTMFLELYRNVLPFIRDTLIAGRAIAGDSSPTSGEGTLWHWLGDQFASSLDDLQHNIKSEVNAGKYRIKFAFIPIAANEFIEITLNPSTSAAIEDIA